MAPVIDQATYLAWEKRMRFDRHGGRARAAKALGVNAETIRNYRIGRGAYSRTLALAMTALALDLPAWHHRMDGMAERD